MPDAHKYCVIMQPKKAGYEERGHYFHAYTAADALTQAKVFFDWQWGVDGYEIHRMETMHDISSER